MNKMRDSTTLIGRPTQGQKICIHYNKSLTQYGARLHRTEIFPDEHLSLDWYEA